MLIRHDHRGLPVAQPVSRAVADLSKCEYTRPAGRAWLGSESELVCLWHNHRAVAQGSVSTKRTGRAGEARGGGTGWLGTER